MGAQLSHEIGVVLRVGSRQQTCASHGPTETVRSGHFVMRPYPKQRSRDITWHQSEKWHHPPGLAKVEISGRTVRHSFAIIPSSKATTLRHACDEALPHLSQHFGTHDDETFQTHTIPNTRHSCRRSKNQARHCASTWRRHPKGWLRGQDRERSGPCGQEVARSAHPWLAVSQSGHSSTPSAEVNESPWRWCFQRLRYRP